MRKRMLIFSAGGVLLIIGAVIGIIAWQRSQDDDALPYGPRPHYAAVNNLAADAVDLSTNAKVFPSLTYGIQTFFWWHPDYRQVGLDHVNIMQFSHIRQDFAWADIEPVQRPKDDPERYVWAQADAMMHDIEAKEVQVIARLDKPPAWALRPDVDYGDIPFDTTRLFEYCGAVATRYQGRITAYQIWNEPNLKREWADTPPSPEGYVDLLKGCSTAIRQADPDAIIISAGMAPTGTRDTTALPDEEFFWKMYQAGAAPYFDVLGVHAPGYAFEPEIDPQAVVEQGYLAWQCFRHVEAVRAIMVANGDEAKQIAITEMGWTIDPRPDSIYHWFAVTPEQQGEYLARAYAYAAEHWRPWVGLMVALYYPNPAWTEDNEEYWWAIGVPTILPFAMDHRPAWPALVQMRKTSSNPDYDHPARDAYFNPIEDD
ncbi:MAG: cellulase family glycosylhydrolase [Anaerolineales bacterium]|nr:cellulase family glycosylhydrolase [Anaerolineales bacterium]